MYEIGSKRAVCHVRCDVLAMGKALLESLAKNNSVRSGHGASKALSNQQRLSLYPRVFGQCHWCPCSSESWPWLLRRTVMDERVQHGLARDRTIDITTEAGRPANSVGPRSGSTPLMGRCISPGRRDWYANLLAHPEFTCHFKQSTTADLPARATQILDTARRRTIIPSRAPASAWMPAWTRHPGEGG